jgi:hypothetical protein
MPANVEGMVREGVNAYRAGKKDEARALLLRAVEIDQYNEQAWLWLSAVVESVDEQRTCLENVLTINPNNERAKQGIDMLAKKGSGAAAPAGGPSDEDVLAGSVFAQSGDDELPSNVDWGGAPAPSAPAPVTASSSASSYYQVDEPSAQEYDSWVANLGLGAGGEDDANPSATLPPTPVAFSTAFVDDDEDLFGANDSVFDMDDEPAAPAKAATPPPAAANKGKVTSPTPKELASSKMDSLLDAIDDDEDDLLVTDFDENYDEAELERLDPSEFFRYIPKEIKATRLPGTREGYPILIILGLVVLLALNVGAVMFLVSQLGAAG